jgi:large subunit ribosomal protein L21
MYAIIKTGGKQYRVAKDDVIDVELLDAEPGSEVEFEEVLMVNNGKDTLFGEPSVSGYVVKGEVVGSAVGPKIISMKYKRSHNTRKKWGHRQHYSRIKILEIGAATGEKKKAAPKKAEEAPVEKEKAPKRAAPAKPRAKAAEKTESHAKPKAAPKRKAKTKEEESK